MVSLRVIIKRIFGRYYIRRSVLRSIEYVDMYNMIGPALVSTTSSTCIATCTCFCNPCYMYVLQHRLFYLDLLHVLLCVNLLPRELQCMANNIFYLLPIYMCTCTFLGQDKIYSWFRSPDRP